MPVGSLDEFKRSLHRSVYHSEVCILVASVESLLGGSLPLTSQNKSKIIHGGQTVVTPELLFRVSLAETLRQRLLQSGKVRLHQHLLYAIVKIFRRDRVRDVHRQVARPQPHPGGGKVDQQAVRPVLGAEKDVHGLVVAVHHGRVRTPRRRRQLLRHVRGRRDRPPPQVLARRLVEKTPRRDGAEVPREALPRVRHVRELLRIAVAEMVRAAVLAQPVGGGHQDRGVAEGGRVEPGQRPDGGEGDLPRQRVALEVAAARAHVVHDQQPALSLQDRPVAVVVPGILAGRRGRRRGRVLLYQSRQVVLGHVHPRGHGPRVPNGAQAVPQQRQDLVVEAHLGPGVVARAPQVGPGLVAVFFHVDVFHEEVSEGAVRRARLDDEALCGSLHDVLRRFVGRDQGVDSLEAGKKIGLGALRGHGEKTKDAAEHCGDVE
mmetsp:Transcript_4204/g.8118  ORF Transcript_4204/g.8118 Transcript_4204/m.8118 type:complete len:432 (-) Transcript_4204:68-1363(-)